MRTRQSSLFFSRAATLALALSATAASAAIVTTTAADDGDLQFNSAAATVSTTGVSASNALRVKMTPVNAGQSLEDDYTGAKPSSTDRISLIRFSTASLESTFSGATVSLTTLTAATNQFSVGQTLYLYGLGDNDPNGQNFSISTTAASFLYGTGGFSKLDPRPVADTIANRINDTLLTPLATLPITTLASGSTTYTFGSDSLTAYILAQKAAGSTAAFVVASDVLASSANLNTPAFYSADNTTTGHISPTLTTYLPEPAAASLLILGLPLLAERNRMRRPS